MMMLIINYSICLLLMMRHKYYRYNIRLPCHTIKQNNLGISPSSTLCAIFTLSASSLVSLSTAYALSCFTTYDYSTVRTAIRFLFGNIILMI